MAAFFIEIICILNIFYIKIKNMNDSKVSILIPLYNAEKYISETIDSVINQKYTNWEVHQ